MSCIGRGGGESEGRGDGYVSGRGREGGEGEKDCVGGGEGGRGASEGGLTALKASRKTLLMAPIRSWISLSGEDEQQLRTTKRK